MPAYDGVLFSPPAPLANVTLRHPTSGNTVSGVKMLIDSGADVTLLPANCIEQLGEIGHANGDVYELMAFDGTKSMAPAVSMELLFLGKTFRGRFLVVDQHWGVLGRNIVNNLRLLFDGPRLAWHET
jgi:hypothetical protein